MGLRVQSWPRIRAEPSVGHRQPEEHQDRSGLAGPVRSEEAEYLPLADLEVQIVHGYEIAVALGQVGKPRSPSSSSAQPHQQTAQAHDDEDDHGYSQEAEGGTCARWSRGSGNSRWTRAPCPPRRCCSPRPRRRSAARPSCSARAPRWRRMLATGLLSKAIFQPGGATVVSSTLDAGPVPELTSSTLTSVASPAVASNLVALGLSCPVSASGCRTALPVPRSGRVRTLLPRPELPISYRPGGALPGGVTRTSMSWLEFGRSVIAPICSDWKDGLKLTLHPSGPPAASWKSSSWSVRFLRLTLKVKAVPTGPVRCVYCGSSLTSCGSSVAGSFGGAGGTSTSTR